jgi:hypothetical protein
MTTITVKLDTKHFKMQADEVVLVRKTIPII